MSTTIKKYMGELESEAEELRESVLVGKQNATIGILAKFFEKMTDALDEVLEGQAKAGGGKDFDKTLESAITNAVSKLKAPVVNVDLNAVAASATEGNRIIAEALTRISQSDNSQTAELLNRLVTALEKNSQAIDIKAELKEIAVALNRKKTHVIKIKRDQYKGAMEELTITEK